MSGGARVSAVVAFFALLALGMLATSEDAKVQSNTSYGAIPSGHGVLFELFGELELPVSRSFAAPGDLPAGATVWWIEPSSEALREPGVSDEPEREGPKSGRERFTERAERAYSLAGPELERWLADGGTALVLLDAASERAAQTFAGVELPARRELKAPGASEADGERAEDDERSERDARTPARRLTVVGTLARAPRVLELQWPVVFADAPRGWRVAARAEGEPFALERRLGSGRLVLVSDATFLHNRWLPREDAAPLALDLVRAYGVPRIDERAHGVSPPRSALRTLARSWAAPFFVGLALAGALFAWFGAALPRRRVGDAEPPAPTLGDYVASLASYYGASREYGRILARYRELTTRRLRRALALPPDTPPARVAQRASRSGRAPTEAEALLANGEGVRDAREFARAVQRLDELVRRVAG